MVESRLGVIPAQCCLFSVFFFSFSNSVVSCSHSTCIILKTKNSARDIKVKALVELIGQALNVTAGDNNRPINS